MRAFGFKALERRSARQYEPFSACAGHADRPMAPMPSRGQFSLPGTSDMASLEPVDPIPGAGRLAASRQPADWLWPTYARANVNNFYQQIGLGGSQLTLTSRFVDARVCRNMRLIVADLFLRSTRRADRRGVYGCPPSGQTNQRDRIIGSVLPWLFEFIRVSPSEPPKSEAFGRRLVCVCLETRPDVVVISEAQVIFCKQILAC